MPRTLDDRIEIYAVLCQRSSDASNNTWAIFHHKSDILRRDKISVDRIPFVANAEVSGTSVHNCQHIRHDRHRSRIAASAMSRENRVAAIFPADNHNVFATLYVG